MSTISSIKLLTVIDSRGYPTLRCLMQSSSGTMVKATTPSGASCGTYEACERRDEDAQVFFGKGVYGVIRDAEEYLLKLLIGFPLGQQEKFDQFLIEKDGTSNKTKFGANVILSLSMAYTKLSAQEVNQELYEYVGDGEYTLPVPLVNVLNGGVHADNSIDIQEFMLVPHGFDTFSTAIRSVCEVFNQLKKNLKAKGFSSNVGDEGGFAPDFESSEHVLEELKNAVIKAGYQPGKEISFALDCAANEMYKHPYYHCDNKKFTSEDWVNELVNWVEKYPIVSIEDGLNEDDVEGWKYLISKIGHQVQCVGDDLFVTSAGRIQTGLKHSLANAVLIKPNQVGTVYETKEAILLNKKSGWNSIMSHRSGDSEDTFIADYCIGMNLGQIKTGSVCRGERTSKYNRILEIEAMTKIPYAKPFA